jgi:prolyl 4-hydroxylase
MDRAEIGRAVRERLLANPAVTRVPALGFELFVCRDFIGAADCAALIARIDATREPSRIVGEHPDPDYRTSETCNLDPQAVLTRGIEAKLADLTGLDPALGETIQGQRYAAGQQFKPHHDYFSVDRPGWEEQDRLGGQRTWTAMIFLNAPEVGGQTAFPEAKVKITPRPGNLLAWNNLREDGAPNESSLHQGMPVEAGTKYILTKWYRERPWGRASSPA